MTTLIHADVFFIITSVAIVLITIAVLVVLIYAIKIFKDVSHISKTVKDETHVLMSKVRFISGKVEQESSDMLEDIKQFRINVLQESTKLTTLTGVVGFVSKFFKKGKKKPEKKVEIEIDTEEETEEE